MRNGASWTRGCARRPRPPRRTLDALAQEWRALRKQVDDADIAAPASFERHTALVARLLLFKNTLLDDFKLSLDADLGASALIAAAYQDLPVAAETLGQVRAARGGAGGRRAGRGAAPGGGHRLARARDMGANIARNLERAGTGAPALAAQIDAAAGRVRQALDGMDERRALRWRARAWRTRSGAAISARPPRSWRRCTARSTAPRRWRPGCWSARWTGSDASRSRCGACWLSWRWLALGVLIARSIAGPLVEAAALARCVAESDLSARRAAGRDETARLLASLNRMSEGLSGTVRQVQAGAAAIEGAAGEIAAGNHDLSRRTEEQAASLEETAASMEQFTATARQNAAEALAAGERAGRGRSGRPGRGSGARGQCRDRRGPGQRGPHLGNHRRDRGHRLPDQHPGAERGGRGRARG